MAGLRPTALFALLRREESGAAGVELGLLLPVAFAVLLALFDLGRLGFAMAMLDNAAQEGAQFASRRGPASMAPASGSEIEAYVRAQVYSALPAEVTVAVAPWPPSASDPTVTVTVEYRFSFLANFVALPTIPLRGTSSMTVL